MIHPLLASGLVLLAFGLLLAGLRLLKQRYAPESEILRKLLHIGTGLICLALPWLFNDPLAVLLLALTGSGLMLLLRISKPARRLTGNVVHCVERHSYGELCFPLGAGLAFLLSQGQPAQYLVALLILSLADAAAALVGQRFGRLRYATRDGWRSIEGSLACWLSAAVSSLAVLLLSASSDPLRGVLVALLLATLCTLVEALSWRGLDNLFLPLAAALLLPVLLAMPATLLLAGLLLAVCASLLLGVNAISNAAAVNDLATRSVSRRRAFNRTKWSL